MKRERCNGNLVLWVRNVRVCILDCVDRYGSRANFAENAEKINGVWVVHEFFFGKSYVFKRIIICKYWM